MRAMKSPAPVAVMAGAISPRLDGHAGVGGGEGFEDAGDGANQPEHGKPLGGLSQIRQPAIDARLIRAYSHDQCQPHHAICTKNKSVPPPRMSSSIMPKCSAKKPIATRGMHKTDQRRRQERHDAKSDRQNAANDEFSHFVRN